MSEEPTNAQKVGPSDDTCHECKTGYFIHSESCKTGKIEALNEKIAALEKENADLKHKLEVAAIVINMALDEANIYFSKDLLMNLERAHAALTPKEKETK